MIIGSKHACTPDYIALLSSDTTIWTLQDLSLRAKWQVWGEHGSEVSVVLRLLVRRAFVF